MSAGAAERDLQPTPRPEYLKRAGRRLRLAQQGYDRFVAVTPLGSEAVMPHRQEEMQFAQEELEAAKKEFSDLYAEFLRTDPEFIAKSEAAERRLAEGPPWDDAFSPSELLKESRQPDR